MENVGLEPLYSIPNAVCKPLHFILHLEAAVGFEPRLKGMSLVSYHCSTTAIKEKVFYLIYPIVHISRPSPYHKNISILFANNDDEAEHKIATPILLTAV